MVKKNFSALKDLIETNLNSFWARVSPRGRITVVLILFLLFAAGSMYMVVITFHDLRDPKALPMLIKHMENPELLIKNQADSIKHQKN